MVWGYHLQTSFPDVYALLDNKPNLVCDCFGGTDWSWHRILSDEATRMPGLRPILLELKERVSNFQIGTRADTIGWRWGSSDLFSVRSTYRMLNDGSTRTDVLN
uniref:Uncharacterized protein n=1 Tax=Ananas comosus var. bracteatus TaxID=296719 RepID=A0A6V7NH36_ANACO|nr:unnamed protein product [Ananas comosus var. bracteatus]